MNSSLVGAALMLSLSALDGTSARSSVIVFMPNNCRVSIGELLFEQRNFGVFGYTTRAIHFKGEYREYNVSCKFKFKQKFKLKPNITRVSKGSPDWGIFLTFTNLIVNCNYNHNFTICKYKFFYLSPKFQTCKVVYRYWTRLYSA